MAVATIMITIITVKNQHSFNSNVSTITYSNSVCEPTITIRSVLIPQGSPIS